MVEDTDKLLRWMWAKFDLEVVRARLFTELEKVDSFVLCKF